jgi:hypothetical protein
MMNATPEVRPVVEDEEGLRREAWMDLPRTQVRSMTETICTEFKTLATALLACIHPPFNVS